MIEKRYAGIAKQGADVVANPTLDGSEANLESIGINGINYNVNKLKLVSSGQLNINSSGCFQIPILLDENKFYLVRCYSDDNGLTYGGIIGGHGYPLPIAVIDAEGNLAMGVGLIIVGVDRTEISISYNYGHTEINENDTYEIYELPFSL